MRPDWHRYFMEIASVTSTRATCLRKQVGAVIVKDRRIISTGYNGSLAGGLHCSDRGCLMVDGHCARTIHAEVNAVAQAAKYGVGIDGADVYVTLKPCWGCFKTLANCGIEHIFYQTEYGGIYPESYVSPRMECIA